MYFSENLHLPSKTFPDVFRAVHCGNEGQELISPLSLQPRLLFLSMAIDTVPQFWNSYKSLLNRKPQFKVVYIVSLLATLLA